jgi:N utilization substance protein A
MTSEELDELIEKTVAAFERIEGVDHDLAERLVEQGILSYDDLSIMEITDLVNTIEGLDEELAVSITQQAEQLAEQQEEEMPRRKGARPAPAAAEGEASPEDGQSPGSLDALFDGAGEALPSPDDEHVGIAVGETTLSEPSAEALDADDGLAEPDDVSLEEFAAGDDLHDLALAAENGGGGGGREVTQPPSDDDQTETAQIVLDAVETGATQQEIEAHEPGAEPGHPAWSPPPEPAPGDPQSPRASTIAPGEDAEAGDDAPETSEPSDMNQP